MDTTTIIITHPQRHTQAQHLAHTLDAHICLDDNNYGPGVNHDRALHQAITTHGDKDGWLILLEDDAIPCNNWHDQIQAALSVAPTPVVSLYLGRAHPRRYQHHIPQLLASNPHWIIHPHLRHHVAVAIHAHAAPQLLATVTPLQGDADKRLGQAAQQCGWNIAYTNPSLCDHQDTTPTITTHSDGTPRPRSEPRHAWNHGTRTHWTTTHLTL